MSRSLTTDVLVIGGGATGVGVVRDLALRGIRAILVEKGDLTHGTTGRYHGLLHSGGRYVVKDPQSAQECAAENEILRRIMPHCIEDTGGLFVITPADDERYAETFVAACRACGVWVDDVPLAEVMRHEPRLNRKLRRAFAVRDAAADAFLATESNAADARARGATLLTYHHVTDLELEGDRVTGARCEDLRSGEAVTIHAAYTINAAGAWAGKIASLAGLDIAVVPGKGTMVAMNHRIVNSVVNRCKPPADGDIIVPIQTVAVLGTTDIAVPDPDVFGIEPDEIALILAEGEHLVPGVSRMRALRAWAGVRPLYRDVAAVDDRDIPRTYKLLNHRTRDGVAGFVSIVGGKWTTYRLMAQEAVDLVAADLGVAIPCRTAVEPLPPVHGAPKSGHLTLGGRLRHVESEELYGDVICECELVTRRQLVDAITTGGAANLDDLRRDTRLGMGPCQGGFCTYRAAGLWHELRGTGDADGVDAAAALTRHFIQERWKGLASIAWGDQLRQQRLDELIALEVLGVDLLPAAVVADGARHPDVVTEHAAIATEYHAE